MIGLDINVLLRLFVQDDEAQVGRASRLVGEATRDSPALVNAIVLSEFAWTLAKQGRKPRKDVAHLIGEVLSADDLEIHHRAAANRALVAYARGKADFADYFICEINAELGCATTATFDRDALDCPLFSAVP
jgi:predicted nucleic-acid-binding protein